jgi:AGZA family xanthine/uracil permease-like MFS transporter
MLYPITSPALIVVGSLMMRQVRDVAWDDFTEAFPAFLTIIFMPFAFNITDGIAFGFISYALLKLVTGRAGDVHWLIYLFAALFILRYAVPGLH